ncbi:MAG TPA: hypothetical protein PLT74_07580, partial [Kiritimatiellia bacterium]|nr:hypothetical protein [Kiritimatiellia bacterium]
LWSYLHQSLAGGERIWKGVRVCRALHEYRRVVDAVFASFAGFVPDVALRGLHPDGSDSTCFLGEAPYEGCDDHHERP